MIPLDQTATRPDGSERSGRPVSSGHAGRAGSPGPVDLDGLAGPGSVAWKINSEVVLLLCWSRAILMQLAHPLVAQGVADHSEFVASRWHRWRRLRQTVGAMLALTFGARQDAAAAAAGVNRIHDRVHGVLREPVGAFPAGTPYSAHDPALLRWVHATLLDTFPLAYRTFVGPLSPEEHERYCREATGLGPLLGVPADQLPGSVASLDAYLREMAGSGQIAVGATARSLVDHLLDPPLPPPLRWLAAPLLWLARLPAIGLLPPALREAYGIGWSARDQAALRVLAAVSRGVVPRLPPIVRYWSVARRAFRRSGRAGP